MIFQYNKEMVYEGLFGSKAAKIYQTKVTEITFERLSLKGKIKALSLGYSPAVPILKEKCWTATFDADIVPDCEVANWLLIIDRDNDVWVRKSQIGQIELI